MEESIKHNIIRILDRAVHAIKEDHIKDLADLSNQTVHDATVYQDEYSVTIAVLVYSLSKIFAREVHYSVYKGWKIFIDDSLKFLEQAKARLMANDVAGFDNSLKGFRDTMQRLDRKLKVYVQDVLQKAKITKASRLYEHGLSMGRTAELLGITRFELMDYVGKTYIADVKENITISAKDRIKIARSLFS